MTGVFEEKPLVSEVDAKEEFIQQWGDFSSDTMLDPEYKCFTVEGINGAIVYKEELGCAVTFGDPLCPAEDIPILTAAFDEFCRENKLNVAYLLVSQSFAKRALCQSCEVLIEVGEELVFNPQCDPLEGPRNKLRNKVNHSQHIGLTLYEYVDEDPGLEKQIQEVGNLWLNERKGPQIYLADVVFFENRENKRWFYIKDGDQVIGVSLLTRLEKRQGWYLKFLIIRPDAPRGTSESLMTFILETLRKEGCEMVTYGVVPNATLGEVVGVSKCSLWFARGAFKIAKRIFKLENRKNYWNQFLPKPEPIYILFGKPHIGIKELRVVLKALKVEF